MKEKNNKNMRNLRKEINTIKTMLFLIIAYGLGKGVYYVASFIKGDKQLDIGLMVGLMLGFCICSVCTMLGWYLAESKKNKIMGG